MEIKIANIKKFAIYHTIYTASNIFYRFDWDERIDDVVDCVSDKKAYFVYDEKNIVGGFTLKDNCLNYPFIVTPYDNRGYFWGVALNYAMRTSRKNELFLNEIPEADAEVLIHSHGAKLRWSKRKMLRPTELCEPSLCDGFYFDNLMKADKMEVVKVIYEAHAAGYTSTIWKPDMVGIEASVERRFDLFGQTNSLFISNVVRSSKDNQIVGVCIAGIYPDSENYSTKDFATINELSVKPQYQRKGIARAMILKSISDASKTSPVMTLGVLIGNPSEKLYKDVGFKQGASYSELLYTVYV